MAGLKPGVLTEKVITGPKYFEEFLPLFQRLHEIGCKGETAGNRDLRFDEHCCLMLFFCGLMPLFVSLSLRGSIFQLNTNGGRSEWFRRQWSETGHNRQPILAPSKLRE